jgi:hypothetical protein
MKIRIPLSIVSIAIILWSCEEPIPYDNASFVYNPFSLTEDTLHSVISTESHASEIEWGSHFRAWVGETQYYKSGFTVGFVFSDTSLDIADVDSIQLQVNHYLTYPENGADTLAASHINFSYYETMDQSIDIENSSYGNFLGTDSMNISGGSNSWKYTLPPGVISVGDTMVSLGIFPAASGYLSSFYGGGSGSRATLKFFFHELDTAGLDSATKIEFYADTLDMYFMEKSAAFNRTQFDYVSQLKNDSLFMTIDLQGFSVGGDTIQHIISSSILPAIDDMASSLYTPDSVFKFSMSVVDPASELSATIEYGKNTFNANQIKQIIQAAIDDKKETIELIVKPTNPGYNPGFLAISKDASASALYIKSSLAVRP